MAAQASRIRARPWAFAYSALFFLMALLVLRHQAYAFKGEDWVDALTGILTRFGFFDGSFTPWRGLRLPHFLSSSYGPVYYTYDAARTLAFKLQLLPFNEVTFRYLTSGTAILLVAGSAAALRHRLDHRQLLTYLLLVGLSPAYVFYYRHYCVYPLMMLFQAAAAACFLRYLESGTVRHLALFYGSLLLAILTFATSVNDAAACGLLLLLARCVRGWAADLPALHRDGVRRLFLGRSGFALAATFVCLLGTVVAFNYRHSRELAGSGGLYQGTLAKSFQKASAGPADPARNAGILVEEAFGTFGPEMVPLAVLALMNVLLTRRLSPLSVLFGSSFLFALAECLLVVPSSQLGFAWRSIAYTFPLLVVIADNAGALLSRLRLGGLILAAATLVSVTHQGLRPLRDLRSVVSPGTAVSPYKALGYVFRVRGLDEAGLACTGFDVPLDGPRLFYLNRIQDGALAAKGGTHNLCALVLSRPPTPRMDRAVRNSRLVHRRAVVEDGGGVVLQVYLNDAMAARWDRPDHIDADEYSRRFTNELHTLDELFASPRWAAAPSASWRGGFY